MNYILSLPGNRKDILEELVKAMPFLKARAISKAKRVCDMADAIKEMKAIEARKRSSRSRKLLVVVGMLLCSTWVIGQTLTYGNESTPSTVIVDVPQDEDWMVATMDKGTHVLVNARAGESSPQILLLGTGGSSTRNWVNIVSGTCGTDYSIPVGAELPVQLPSGYAIFISTEPGTYVRIVRGPKK